MPTDASRSVPHADLHGATALADAAPVGAGLTWRHAATVLLLIITLPVFAGAALVCLPLLVVGVLAQQILKFSQLLPAAQRAPARMARLR